MIETIEQLKELRPDLVLDFESMTHKELLSQTYLEVIDAINMEERVQIFMNECTDMSKTTYTIDVIKQLIQDKCENNISQFCEMALEDIEDMNVKEIKKYLSEEIIK